MEVLKLCMVLVWGAAGLPEPEAGLEAEQILLSRTKRGGACKSTADCVPGNVCRCLQ